MDATLTTPPDELLLGFARALRAAGLPITADRSQEFLRATSIVGLGDQQATYWAGRATLCAGQHDLDRYDQVFHAWFIDRDRPAGPREQGPPATPQATLAEQETAAAGDEDVEDVRALASEAEVLRHRDVAELDARERLRLTEMFARLDPQLPRRRASRRTPWHRGEVDSARTLRRMLRQMGEPTDVAWRRRTARPRRLVLLVDVSGSMTAYADALLRLAHRVATAPRVAATGGTVEVFTLGTRLTHVTRAMRRRDAEQAIVAAGETVPDWSGGTRLGETLRAFLTHWGQRGMARGAVVVVFSDGWERGDADLLRTQMQRLHRLAHRVVWVNPHRGKEGYEPVQQGIVAALPSVDDFVAGHSLATFEELLEVVARA